MRDLHIPSSWQTTTLGEASEIFDSLHKSPAYAETGLPMVRVTDVRSGFLDLTGTTQDI